MCVCVCVCACVCGKGGGGGWVGGKGEPRVFFPLYDSQLEFSRTMNLHRNLYSIKKFIFKFSRDTYLIKVFLW